MAVRLNKPARRRSHQKKIPRQKKLRRVQGHNAKLRPIETALRFRSQQQKAQQRAEQQKCLRVLVESKPTPLPPSSTSVPPRNIALAGAQESAPPPLPGAVSALDPSGSVVRAIAIVTPPPLRPPPPAVTAPSFDLVFTSQIPLPSTGKAIKLRRSESLFVPLAVCVIAMCLIYLYPSRPTLIHRRIAATDLVETRAQSLPDDTSPGSATAGPVLQSLPPASDLGVVAMLAEPQFTNARSDIDGTPLSTRDVGETRLSPRLRSCTFERVAAPMGPPAPPPSGEAFGYALAEAAERQTGEFVVYADDYRGISYPGGDVRSFYGVCTDVVIRAYRALGIDLQRLVHEARVGSGDTSIDHRRTEILRRFFSKHGTVLETAEYADAYRPGDIVTYDRPQNRGTQAHIAIVANATGPSGRPMIVHNRGWGPQLEDALFVDDITGHYRFANEPPPSATDRIASLQSAASRKSTPSLVRRANINRAFARPLLKKPATTAIAP